MVLHRAFPVISHHVNRIGFNPARRKGPIVRILEIGFILLLAIDEEPSVLEFNLLIFEPDDSLQESYPLTSETDDHDIASFGF